MPLPLRIAALSAAVLTATALAGPSLAATSHTTPSTLSTGSVVAWGDDTDGETDVPAALADQDVVAVSASLRSSLAVTRGGQVVGWGDTTTLPPELSAQPITAVSAGIFQNAALTSDGTVLTWTTGSSALLPVPTAVAAQPISALASGGDGLLFDGGILALTSQGQVLEWNRWMGSSTTDLSSVLPSNARFTAVATSMEHALALTDDGHVVQWESYGTSAQPDPVPTEVAQAHVVAISAGGQDNMMALTDAGQVLTWGYQGQAVPADLANTRVTSISAGLVNDTVVTADHRVVSFGSGSYGQNTLPSGLDGKVVTGVATGWFHTLAIVHDVVPGVTTPDPQPTVPTTTTTLTTSTRVAPGRAVTATATGLAPNEPFRIRMRHRTLAHGRADAAGAVHQKVRIPSRFVAGHPRMWIRGLTSGRAASQRVTLTQRAVGLSLSASNVRAGDDVTVTVRNLRPHQQVTLRYAGKVVTNGLHADRQGRVQYDLPVGSVWGTFPVTVSSGGTSVTRKLTVVQRCTDGQHTCAKAS